MVHVGVWENKKFIGVVLFSRGATPNLLNKYGLKQTEGCELTRIALASHSVEVTRIVKIALKFLKQHNPGLRLVVSFADPEEGHIGAIYQAGNWIYTGQNNASTEYIGPDGKKWHGRMVKKQGFTTVYGTKRKVLTPSQCTPIKRQGKHRYLMPLDDEIRKQIELLRKPYPKNERATKAISGDPLESGGAVPTCTLQK